MRRIFSAKKSTILFLVIMYNHQKQSQNVELLMQEDDRSPNTVDYNGV